MAKEGANVTLVGPPEPGKSWTYDWLNCADRQSTGKSTTRHLVLTNVQKGKFLYIFRAESAGQKPIISKYTVDVEEVVPYIKSLVYFAK